jgi:hypothetical protein
VDVQNVDRSEIGLKLGVPSEKGWSGELYAKLIDNGITQKEFARLIGHLPGVVNNWVQGKVSPPDYARHGIDLFLQEVIRDKEYRAKEWQRQNGFCKELGEEKARVLIEEAKRREKLKSLRAVKAWFAKWGIGRSTPPPF